MRDIHEHTVTKSRSIHSEEKELEVEEQWWRGGGALKSCFRVQGLGIDSRV